MAKVFLRGAALLVFLPLVRSGVQSEDFVCDVAIERTDLEDSGKVQLNCIVIGNVTSLTWTRDGQPIPVIPSQLANLMIEVPSKYAKGNANFMCQARCNHLKQRARISLGSFGRPDLEMTIALAISVFMTVVFILIALIHLGFYYRRHRRRMRAAQGSPDDLGPGVHAMVLTARPLIAPPLAASQVV